MKKFDVYLDKRKMGKSKDRIYSLRDTKTQLVKHKSSFIILKNVEFVVQQSGFKDTLSTGKKFVHSFLRGDCVFRGRNAQKKMSILDAFNPNNTEMENVGYNPIICNKWLKIPSFSVNQLINTDEQLDYIKSSNYALIHNKGICVINDIDFN